jgi:hypothetical protein
LRPEGSANRIANRQAREHGLNAWADLVAAVEALKAHPSREPFRLAFEALEVKDDVKLASLLKRHPSLATASGTNGNQLLHFAVNHGAASSKRRSSWSRAARI